MAFVWSEDISIPARHFAAGMNEVQDNIDTLYTALELIRPGCVGGAGWTLFPLTDGVDHILRTQPQQLRDAIDYAHENWCLVYQSAYQDGVDTTEETGYRNAHLEGYDITYDGGYRATYDATYNPGYLAGYDANYYPGRKISYDTGGE